MCQHNIMGHLWDMVMSHKFIGHFRDVFGTFHCDKFVREEEAQKCIIFWYKDCWRLSWQLSWRLHISHTPLSLWGEGEGEGGGGNREVNGIFITLLRKKVTYEVTTMTQNILFDTLG